MDGVELHLAVIRLKPSPSAQPELKPKCFDLMLIDSKAPAAVAGVGGGGDSSAGSGSQAETKQLPRVVVPHDTDPAERALDHLFLFTGAERGGLRALRALFVSPSPYETEVNRKLVIKAALFCLVVDPGDKLNPSFVDNIPSTPGFYDLAFVADASSASNNTTFSRPAKVMLNRLLLWMEEKCGTENFVDMLLRPPVDARLVLSVDNPAYIPRNRSTLRVFKHSGLTNAAAAATSENLAERCTANVAFTRMMAIEKCDRVVINALFGSGLPYKPGVDAYSVNKFWGMGKPDMTKIKLPPARMMNKSSDWAARFPLHKLAFEGDALQIMEHLKLGYKATERDFYAWMPIHYAAWFGCLEACRALLTEGGCSPNVVTLDDSSTPLHFAAINGQRFVVEFLISLDDTDVNCLNKDKKSPLSLCEKATQPKFIHCKEILQRAMDRPYKQIAVHLLDSEEPLTLKLVSDDKTTVQQLHQQAMKELRLTKAYESYFTLWICSENLQLQLKREHQVVDQLSKWSEVVVNLTDFPPDKEQPKLSWKRDVRLEVTQEKKIKNVQAIRLLFSEAYRNYITAMYPCDETDALLLAGLLVHMRLGDFDAKVAKSFLASESNLQELVPFTLLSKNRSGWAGRVHSQYKRLSQQIHQLANTEQEVLVHHLQFQFLTICWNLTVYGSAFFSGYLVAKNNKQAPIHIGVNDFGLHIIARDSKAMLQSYNYEHIDWTLSDGRQELDVREKKTGKDIYIRTKQANLISSLMKRLGYSKMAEERR